MTRKAAKKSAAKKTVRKKAASKAAKKKTAKKKPVKKKTTVKKSAAKKKSAVRKAATKKTTKKATSKKAVGKKTAKKRVVKKPAKKKASKKAAVKKKPVSKKRVSKKAVPGSSSSRVPAGKPASVPSSPSKPSASTKPEAVERKPEPETPDKKAGGRKGITIVSKRPGKRSKTKPKRKPFVMPGERLLGPNAPVRKPLIPSGPSAAPSESLASKDVGKPRKSPFGKRELEKFRKLLLAKRAELLGDMEQIESDALRSESGDLSHFPQHMADQGSDSYEQSLSLDLAAADRRMIKEIDDALQRITDKVYGLCQLTNRPISVARLNELPWARYSIEAAREIERRGGL